MAKAILNEVFCWTKSSDFTWIWRYFGCDSFMLQGLHNLEELYVGECSSVKEVFQLEGLEEEHQAKPLRWLRKIWLEDLPRLTHLWKENNKPGPNLQSLESLELWL